MMEPICYFISTGYGLLFYTLFFLPTKRDPTVSGIFGHLSRTSTERALLRMPQAKQWYVVLRRCTICHVSV